MKHDPTIVSPVKIKRMDALNQLSGTGISESTVAFHALNQSSYPESSNYELTRPLLRQLLNDHLIDIDVYTEVHQLFNDVEATERYFAKQREDLLEPVLSQEKPGRLMPVLGCQPVTLSIMDIAHYVEEGVIQEEDFPLILKVLTQKFIDDQELFTLADLTLLYERKFISTDEYEDGFAIFEHIQTEELMVYDNDFDSKLLVLTPQALATLKQTERISNDQFDLASGWFDLIKPIRQLSAFKKAHQDQIKSN